MLHTTSSSAGTHTTSTDTGAIQTSWLALRTAWAPGDRRWYAALAELQVALAKHVVQGGWPVQASRAIRATLWHAVGVPDPRQRPVLAALGTNCLATLAAITRHPEDALDAACALHSLSARGRSTDDVLPAHAALLGVIARHVSHSLRVASPSDAGLPECTGVASACGSARSVLRAADPMPEHGTRLVLMKGRGSPLAAPAPASRADQGTCSVAPDLLAAATAAGVNLDAMDAVWTVLHDGARKVLSECGEVWSPRLPQAAALCMLPTSARAALQTLLRGSERSTDALLAYLASSVPIALPALFPQPWPAQLPSPASRCPLPLWVCQVVAGDQCATQATRVHAVGQHAEGELGMCGSSAELSVPLAGHRVVGLAAGRAHSLLLTDEGKVLASGANQHGQCFAALPKSARAAAVVALAEVAPWAPASACQVWAGPDSDHSFVGLNDGTLVAAGPDACGPSWGDASSSAPADTLFCRVKLPLRVTKVACSYVHSLFLLADGSVFGAGSNSHGQLAGSLAALAEPAEIDLPAAAKPVCDIACGQHHSLMLASSGSLWGAGRNDSFQVCAHAPRELRQVQRVVLGEAAAQCGPITRITAGNSHSLALTAWGSVLGWGRRDAGALGMPGDGRASAACSVLALPPMCQIEAGGQHSVCVAADGMLYVSGRNTHGQLLLDDRIDRFNFVPVSRFVGHTIAHVECGQSHTLVLVSDGVAGSPRSQRCLHFRCKPAAGASPPDLATSLLTAAHWPHAQLSARWFHAWANAPQAQTGLQLDAGAAREAEPGCQGAAQPRRPIGPKPTAFLKRAALWRQRRQPDPHKPVAAHGALASAGAPDSPTARSDHPITDSSSSHSTPDGHVSAMVRALADAAEESKCPVTTWPWSPPEQVLARCAGCMRDHLAASNGHAYDTFAMAWAAAMLLGPSTCCSPEAAEVVEAWYSTLAEPDTPLDAAALVISALSANSRAAHDLLRACAARGDDQAQRVARQVCAAIACYPPARADVVQAISLGHASALTEVLLSAGLHGRALLHRALQRCIPAGKSSVQLFLSDLRRSSQGHEAATSLVLGAPQHAVISHAVYSMWAAAPGDVVLARLAAGRMSAWLESSAKLSQPLHSCAAVGALELATLLWPRSAARKPASSPELPGFGAGALEQLRTMFAQRSQRYRLLVSRPGSGVPVQRAAWLSALRLLPAPVQTKAGELQAVSGNTLATLERDIAGALAAVLQVAPAARANAPATAQQAAVFALAACIRHRLHAAVQAARVACAGVSTDAASMEVAMALGLDAAQAACKSLQQLGGRAPAASSLPRTSRWRAIAFAIVAAAALHGGASSAQPTAAAVLGKAKLLSVAQGERAVQAAFTDDHAPQIAHHIVRVCLQVAACEFEAVASAMAPSCETAARNFVQTLLPPGPHAAQPRWTLDTLRRFTMACATLQHSWGVRWAALRGYQRAAQAAAATGNPALLDPLIATCCRLLLCTRSAPAVESDLLAQCWRQQQREVASIVTVLVGASCAHLRTASGAPNEQLLALLVALHPGSVLLLRAIQALGGAVARPRQTQWRAEAVLAQLRRNPRSATAIRASASLVRQLAAPAIQDLQACPRAISISPGCPVAWLLPQSRPAPVPAAIQLSLQDDDIVRMVDSEQAAHMQTPSLQLANIVLQQHGLQDALAHLCALPDQDTGDLTLAVPEWSAALGASTCSVEMWVRLAAGATGQPRFLVAAGSAMRSARAVFTLSPIDNSLQVGILCSRALAGEAEYVVEQRWPAGGAVRAARGQATDDHGEDAAELRSLAMASTAHMCGVEQCVVVLQAESLPLHAWSHIALSIQFDQVCSVDALGVATLYVDGQVQDERDLPWPLADAIGPRFVPATAPAAGRADVPLVVGGHAGCFMCSDECDAPTSAWDSWHAAIPVSRVLTSSGEVLRLCTQDWHAANSDSDSGWRALVCADAQLCDARYHESGLHAADVRARAQRAPSWTSDEPGPMISSFGHAARILSSSVLAAALRGVAEAGAAVSVTDATALLYAGLALLPLTSADFATPLILLRPTVATAFPLAAWDAAVCALLRGDASLAGPNASAAQLPAGVPSLLLAVLLLGAQHCMMPGPVVLHGWADGCVDARVALPPGQFPPPLLRALVRVFVSSSHWEAALRHVSAHLAVSMRTARAPAARLLVAAACHELLQCACPQPAALATRWDTVLLQTPTLAACAIAECVQGCHSARGSAGLAQTHGTSAAALLCDSGMYVAGVAQLHAADRTATILVQPAEPEAADLHEHELELLPADLPGPAGLVLRSHAVDQHAPWAGPVPGSLRWAEARTPAAGAALRVPCADIVPAVGLAHRPPDCMLAALLQLAQALPREPGISSRMADIADTACKVLLHRCETLALHMQDTAAAAALLAAGPRAPSAIVPPAMASAAIVSPVFLQTEEVAAHEGTLVNRLLSVLAHCTGWAQAALGKDIPVRAVWAVSLRARTRSQVARVGIDTLHANVGGAPPELHRMRMSGRASSAIGSDASLSLPLEPVSPPQAAAPPAAGLAALEDMGYPAAWCRLALALCANEVMLAAAWLVDNAELLHSMDSLHPGHGHVYMCRALGLPTPRAIQAEHAGLLVSPGRVDGSGGSEAEDGQDSGHGEHSGSRSPLQPAEHGSSIDSGPQAALPAAHDSGHYRALGEDGSALDDMATSAYPSSVDSASEQEHSAEDSAVLSLDGSVTDEVILRSASYTSSPGRGRVRRPSDSQSGQGSQADSSVSELDSDGFSDSDASVATAPMSAAAHVEPSAALRRLLAASSPLSGLPEASPGGRSSIVSGLSSIERSGHYRFSFDGTGNVTQHHAGVHAQGDASVAPAGPVLVLQLPGGPLSAPAVQRMLESAYQQLQTADLTASDSALASHVVVSAELASAASPPGLSASSSPARQAGSGAQQPGGSPAGPGLAAARARRSPDAQSSPGAAPLPGMTSPMTLATRAAARREGGQLGQGSHVEQSTEPAQPDATPGLSRAALLGIAQEPGLQASGAGLHNSEDQAQLGATSTPEFGPGQPSVDPAHGYVPTPSRAQVLTRPLSAASAAVCPLLAAAAQALTPQLAPTAQVPDAGLPELDLGGSAPGPGAAVAGAAPDARMAAPARAPARATASSSGMVLLADGPRAALALFVHFQTQLLPLMAPAWSICAAQSKRRFVTLPLSMPAAEWSLCAAAGIPPQVSLLRGDAHILTDVLPAEELRSVAWGIFEGAEIVTPLPGAIDAEACAMPAGACQVPWQFLPVHVLGTASLVEDPFPDDLPRGVPPPMPTAPTANDPHSSSLWDSTAGQHGHAQPTADAQHLVRARALPAWLQRPAGPLHWYGNPVGSACAAGLAGVSERVVARIDAWAVRAVAVMQRVVGSPMVASDNVTDGSMYGPALAASVNLAEHADFVVPPRPTELGLQGDGIAQGLWQSSRLEHATANIDQVSELLALSAEELPLPELTAAMFTTGNILRVLIARRLWLFETAGLHRRASVDEHAQQQAQHTLALVHMIQLLLFRGALGDANVAAVANAAPLGSHLFAPAAFGTPAWFGPAAAALREARPARCLNVSPHFIPGLAALWEWSGPSGPASRIAAAAIQGGRACQAPGHAALLAALQAIVVYHVRRSADAEHAMVAWGRHRLSVSDAGALGRPNLELADWAWAVLRASSAHAYSPASQACLHWLAAEETVHLALQALANRNAGLKLVGAQHLIWLLDHTQAEVRHRTQAALQRADVAAFTNWLFRHARTRMNVELRTGRMLLSPLCAAMCTLLRLLNGCPASSQGPCGVPSAAAAPSHVRCSLVDVSSETMALRLHRDGCADGATSHVQELLLASTRSAASVPLASVCAVLPWGAGLKLDDMASGCTASLAFPGWPSSAPGLAGLYTRLQGGGIDRRRLAGLLAQYVQPAVQAWATASAAVLPSGAVLSCTQLWVRRVAALHFELMLQTQASAAAAQKEEEEGDLAALLLQDDVAWGAAAVLATMQGMPQSISSRCFDGSAASCEHAAALQSIEQALCDVLGCAAQVEAEPTIDGETVQPGIIVEDGGHASSCRPWLLRMAAMRAVAVDACDSAQVTPPLELCYLPAGSCFALIIADLEQGTPSASAYSPATAVRTTHAAGWTWASPLATHRARFGHASACLPGAESVVVGADGLTATHRAANNWTVLRSNVGMTHGRNTWSIRIDRTPNAYLFIGVTTAAASRHSFLGADECSWGWLADRALYHRRTKVGTYGVRFGAGDVVSVSLDLDAGTLSYAVNGRWFGVAFRGIAGYLFPAVAFFSHGQRITLLPLPAGDLAGPAPRRAELAMDVRTAWRVPPPLPIDQSASVAPLHAPGASTPPFLQGTPLAVALSEVLDVADCASWLAGQCTQRAPPASVVHLVTKAWQAYQAWPAAQHAAVHSLAAFDACVRTDRAALAGFGVRPGQRVLTPKGAATVIGVHAHRLWGIAEDDFGPWLLPCPGAVALRAEPNPCETHWDSAEARRKRCGLVLLDADAGDDACCKPAASIAERAILSHAEFFALAGLEWLPESHCWAWQPGHASVWRQVGLLEALTHMAAEPPRAEQASDVWRRATCDVASWQHVAASCTASMLQQAAAALAWCGLDSRIQPRAALLAWAAMLRVWNERACLLQALADAAACLPAPHRAGVGAALDCALPGDALRASATKLSRAMSSIRGTVFPVHAQALLRGSMDVTAVRPMRSDDELEYPPEIVCVSVDRPAAESVLRSAAAALAAGQPVDGRYVLAASVFGQLWRQLAWAPTATRRLQFTHPMDDQQSRAFRVKLLGEGADDYGGVYREALLLAVDQLFADAVTEQPVLPLFSPCAYGSAPKDVCWAVTAPGTWPRGGRHVHAANARLACAGPLDCTLLSAYEWLGALLGIMARSSVQADVPWPADHWRRLAGQPPSIPQFDAAWATALAAGLLPDLAVPVHVLSVPEVDAVDRELAMRCAELLSPRATQGKTAAEVWQAAAALQFRFAPDVQLLPRALPCEDLDAAQVARLAVLCIGWSVGQFTSSAIDAMRSGLTSLVPSFAVAAQTGTTLAGFICGTGDWPVSALQEHTDYDSGIAPHDCHVHYFWEVLHELSPGDKQAFLRFAWARTKLPASRLEWRQRFKLQALATPAEVEAMQPQAAQATIDRLLPRAHTCFAALALPAYSSKAVCQERLLYAIHNCVSMDADFAVGAGESEHWPSEQ